ncbi:MAG: glycosyltransferase family 4 protein [Acidimicrobiales bacterium]|nr:glycosyltransferase family 4 protein [Acidimicrobiales bacterium]
MKLGDLAASAGLSRIHLLAWRDLDDVEAGGSEVHAANVARLWAEAGIEVTMRTSYAQGHPPADVRDGYHVVRKAGRYLVFPRAALSEATGRHGPRDGLVEIWNGMPFLSPLWAGQPRVVWLHHVHGDMWKMVLPPRLAAMGQLLEHRIAPALYRGTRIVTLSESSKRQLVDELAFRPDRVSVVPPGIDPRFAPGGPRSAHPLVVAVGRLVPVKHFDVLIRVMAEVRRRRPDATLTIVGEGYERRNLDQVVRELDAESWVTFAGRIDDDELVELYRRAWVVASASSHEGWGMTLTEAAACGTPAVATRISGHLDAVAEGTGGLLAEDERELAEQLAAVLGDPGLRDRLSAGALEHAQQFTWEATAAGTLAALAQEARRRRR